MTHDAVEQDVTLEQLHEQLETMLKTMRDNNERLIHVESELKALVSLLFQARQPPPTVSGSTEVRLKVDR